MENHFLYTNENLTVRLKVLKNLIKSNDCLSLVIGEKGSGKTTLLKELLASFDPDWRYCKILFQSRKDIKKLEAVGNLNGRKGILLNTGGPPILIIDDAHEINIEGLCYLLRHAFNACETQKIRGMVLFCEPPAKGFVKRLYECVPTPSAANTIYIKPLTQEQTAQYLHQFSIYTGLPEKKRFSGKQVKKIFTVSRGLPGKIRDEAQRILDGSPFCEKTGRIRKFFLAAAH